MTEQEQLYFYSTYFWSVLADLDQELRVYHVWEQTYPQDWVPWNNSAADLNNLGEYDGSLKEAQEALRLNPDHATCYFNTGSAFLALNRRDEAKQVAQRALAHGLDTSVLHFLLYQVAFVENDVKGMEEQVAESSGKPEEELVLLAQSATEAYFGRLGNARRLSNRAVENARRGNFKELAAEIRDVEALDEAEFGYSELAKQGASAALTLSSGRTAKLYASLAFARAGDATRAQGLVDELNKRFPSDTLLQRYWLPTIRGAIAFARKTPPSALGALQSVSYELGIPQTRELVLYPAYGRGQTYLAARQGKEAAVEFEKFLEHRSIASNSPLGALAHLGLGRAYVLSGDLPKARAAYQDFLGLWKDADPDIPIFRQAKAEYAKVQ